MVHHIRPTDLEAWYANAQGPGQPLVLDVREPHEWALARVVAHGVEVLHIPMGEVSARVHELPTERPIACLCHHGVRSLHVAQWLHSQGLDALANIDGGIDAWSTERDATVARY